MFFSLNKIQTRRKPVFFKLLLIGLLLCLPGAIKAQLITLSVKQAPLKEVLKKISSQSGYKFWYNNASLQRSNLVTMNVKEATLKNVLMECFSEQPFDYEIVDKTIVIKLKASMSIHQKSHVLNYIKGIVTNSDGHPLENVNVTIKEIDAFTRTDVDGQYEISADSHHDLIEFSLIGYRTQKVQINHRAILNVRLEDEVGQLDQVQVIGYGTTTQRKSTGNVTTITAEDIAKQPVPNIIQALQGRVPGLVVNQANGFFSGNYSVKIRGSNTIPLTGLTAVSDPLYVIDGIPLTIGNGDPLGRGMNQNGLTGPAAGQNPLIGINPADIESISVLKDADATAIYGARGANGVILITTKKAKVSKTTVDVNIFTGVSQQHKKLDLMNTAQYLAMRREAFKNDGVTPDNGNAYDLLIWDTSRQTNWQKELLSSAKTTDLSFGISGGDIKTKFRLSGGYHRETPPFPGDFSERRISTLLNLSHSEFNQKLNASLILDLAGINSNLPQSDPTGQIFNAPNAPSIYDSNGNLNYAGWRPGNFPSSFAALKQPYKSNTKNLSGNLTLTYNLLPGLSLAASGGYNLGNQNQLALVPGSSLDPAGAIERKATYGQNNVQTWLFEPTIKWSVPLKNGKIESLIGATYQENVIDGNVITAKGFVSDQQLENRTAASIFSDGKNNYAQTRIQSVFARLNYNLLEKYILTLSMRRDGSSRFGPGNQFGNFGSIGAAWIFSEEPVVKRWLPILSFGKLRGSYGITGGDAIGDYAYLSTLKSGSSPYQGTPVLLLDNASNPGFKWTENKKLDLSLNLGFLEDRFLLNASWFRNRCGNQLVNYTLPRITGFGSVINNLPALVQNQGFEFDFVSKNVTTRRFSWSTSANIGFTRNKLIDFPGLESSSYKNLYTIGQSISRTELFHFLGIDPKTGKYSIEDKNQNGLIDYQIDQNYYNTDASFTGGIENNLQFGSLSLSFFFTFAKQKGLSNAYNLIPGYIGANQLTGVLNNRWQNPGDVSKSAGFTTTYTEEIDYFLQSDGLWGDASYIRLQNVSLSYNLNASSFHAIKMPNIRLSLQGSNLLTISNYKGIDPSSPTTGLTLPSRRVMTARIQFVF